MSRPGERREAGPSAFRLFDGLPDCITGSIVSKTALAINMQRVFRFLKDIRLGIRTDTAVFDRFKIGGDPQYAVRVVSSEVGFYQDLGNGVRDVLWCACCDEEIVCEFLEIRGFKYMPFHFFKFPCGSAGLNLSMPLRKRTVVRFVIIFNGVFADGDT